MTLDIEDILPEGNSADELIMSLQMTADQFGNSNFIDDMGSRASFGLKELPKDLSLKDFPYPIGDAFRILNLNKCDEHLCARWIRFEPFALHSHLGNKPLIFKTRIFIPADLLYQRFDKRIERLLVDENHLPFGVDSEDFSSLLYETSGVDGESTATNGPTLSSQDMVNVLNFAKRANMGVIYRVIRKNFFTDMEDEEYIELEFNAYAPRKTWLSHGRQIHLPSRDRQINFPSRHEELPEELSDELPDYSYLSGPVSDYYM